MTARNSLAVLLVGAARRQVFRKRHKRAPHSATHTSCMLFILFSVLILSTGCVKDGCAEGDCIEPYTEHKYTFMLTKDSVNCIDSDFANLDSAFFRILKPQTDTSLNRRYVSFLGDRDTIKDKDCQFVLYYGSLLGKEHDLRENTILEINYGNNRTDTLIFYWGDKKFKDSIEYEIEYFIYRNKKYISGDADYTIPAPGDQVIERMFPFILKVQ